MWGVSGGDLYGTANAGGPDPLRRRVGLRPSPAWREA